MFDSQITVEQPDQIYKYRLFQDAKPLSYGQTLDLLGQREVFRDYLIGLLADCPFAAYRWETPAVTTRLLDQSFEFVLVNAPSFADRRSDSRPFEDNFVVDDSNQGIVQFVNLGRDATMIVPSPRTGSDVYGHLASFVRHAPRRQVDTLWKTVGTVMADQLNDNPVWLNTAGGGVAWLHVRLDSRPKYYAYSPYKAVAEFRSEARDQ